MSKIPKENLTLKNLLEKHGKLRENCFHAAALYGSLDQIPKEFLTAENLAIKNKKGQNSFHFAAACANLHQIPKQFLTPGNLLAKARGRVTSPLHYYFVTKALQRYPLEFNPREWTPYLKELQKMKKDFSNKDTVENTALKRLEQVIEKIEEWKKFKDLPSLKI